MSLMKKTIFAIALSFNLCFVSAAEYSQTKTESFGGVGITLVKKGQQLVVNSVIKGSPADLAGIQSDDMILTVDGQEMSILTMSEALGIMRGVAGDEMNIVLGRNGAEVLDFAIDRVKMEINQGYLKAESSTTLSSQEIKDKMNAQAQAQIFLNGKILESEQNVRSHSHVYSVVWGTQSNKGAFAPQIERFRVNSNGESQLTLNEDAPYQAHLLDLNGKLLAQEKGAGETFTMSAKWTAAHTVVRVIQKGQLFQYKN